MRIYEKSFDYNYPFPTVTLAYFLRYPNPYSKHVLSTDVIERYVDPETNRLHTTRLHLKKSKVPSAILKLLPRGLAGPGGASSSYVLEKSVVDIKEGWMDAESKNLEWTGILSVREHHYYKRGLPPSTTWLPPSSAASEEQPQDGTTCKTTVTCVSKLGQARLSRRKADNTDQPEPPKLGFFSSWSTAGLQRTVELVGVKRTKTAIVNGSEGMNVVLERLRQGGIRGVLEGMRRDRMEALGTERPWRQVWLNGQSGSDDPPAPRSD